MTEAEFWNVYRKTTKTAWSICIGDTYSLKGFFLPLLLGQLNSDPNHIASIALIGTTIDGSLLVARPRSL